MKLLNDRKKYEYEINLLLCFGGLINLINQNMNSEVDHDIPHF